MDIPGNYDGELTVAIRPEGFIPCADGAMGCALLQVEVMGRDTSVLCDHEAFIGENFRAIIDSDDREQLSGKEIRFDLKPNKVFLFHRQTGERIRF